MPVIPEDATVSLGWGGGYAAALRGPGRTADTLRGLHVLTLPPETPGWPPQPPSAVFAGQKCGPYRRRGVGSRDQAVSQLVADALIGINLSALSGLQIEDWALQLVKRLVTSISAALRATGFGMTRAGTFPRTDHGAQRAATGRNGGLAVSRR